MPLITMGTGLFLIIVGIVGYVSTEMISVTALIPSFFGAALLLLGVLAQLGMQRKHVMHAAAALGLIGFVVPLSRIVPKLVTGGEINWPALIEQAVMLLTCLIFVGLCVKSFIDARRSRTQTEAATSGEPSGAR